MTVFLTGWILVFLASSAQASTCVCVATSGGGDLNIRACPDTTCELLGVESPGSCFTWSQTSNGWHEFDYNGQNAWASGDYMSGPQLCADGAATCFNQLCANNPSNAARRCDDYGCGNYLASRGDRLHYGVDVLCDAGADIYAPIDGVINLSIPYGDGSCCDDGFNIQGSGAWSGHLIKVFYCNSDNSLFGQQVNRGQVIAYHIGLHCGCYGSGMTDHSHIQDSYNGDYIDPSGCFSIKLLIRLGLGSPSLSIMVGMVSSVSLTLFMSYPTDRAVDGEISKIRPQSVSRRACCGKLASTALMFPSKSRKRVMSWGKIADPFTRL
ncbi:hypothetical protein LSH36_27g06052 [Paralvinella palmiformis]|uniref:Uncharacterized protein n=1 Tax=Paralvinella palmiformis TaxID=53620 RepID=A0AAD9NG90_9ANNE|nr:hypothetical protein LSH36_27g06052 [Paralvinella palmiformis]